MAKGFAEGHNKGIGKGDYAGLPTEVIRSQYPKSKNYPDSELDDSMTGIDEVVDRCVGKATKHKSYQK
jgi:hypothetical protein